MYTGLNQANFDFKPKKEDKAEDKEGFSRC
jgi:hypothetical protein